jgi:predicted metal-dependent hydrolase
MKMKVMPVRRDLKVKLPEERVTDWHAQGSHVTHFFNALSIFFPAGERFFMDSVRLYRDQVSDPELKQAVLAFIGQEAMHSREHIEYNEMLENAGLPAHKMDKFVWDLLANLKKALPQRLQLAGTIALEHYTAVLGDMILRHPEKLEGSDPQFVRMWRWHALEETEHKAVAYDVWNATSKQPAVDYANRVIAMFLATAILWPSLAMVHARLVMADEGCKKNRLRGYIDLAKFLVIDNGPFRRLIPETLQFFKPGFHPWDQDNSELLAEIETIIKLVKKEERRAVAKAA